MAHDAAEGTWRPVGPAYLPREILERAVFDVGVPALRDNVGYVIMRRLVMEGRAERVPAPAVDLTTMRPKVSQYLGEWFNATR